MASDLDGFRSPLRARNDFSNGGDEPWINASTSSASKDELSVHLDDLSYQGSFLNDDAYVKTVALVQGNNDTTVFLRVDHFNFDLPTGSTLTGLKIKWNGASITSPYGTIQDGSLKLVVAGSYENSDDMADAADNWSSDADGHETRSDGLNLEGYTTETLTPAKVNSPSFGVCLSVQNQVYSAYARIDVLRIKLWYDLPDDTIRSSSLTHWQRGSAIKSSTLSGIPVHVGTNLGYLGSKLPSS